MQGSMRLIELKRTSTVPIARGSPGRAGCRYRSLRPHRERYLVQAHTVLGVEFLASTALRDAAEHSLNTGASADANPGLVNYDSDNDTILIKVASTTTVDTILVAHIHDGAANVACGREVDFLSFRRQGRVHRLLTRRRRRLRAR